jgi:glycerol-3-phosphate acyltransferase PlsY
VSFVVVAIGAYLLGSIPTGFLAGKAKGVDIRALGSGNIGATNVLRFLGKPAGILVLLIDALKGYLSCAILVPVVILCFALDAPAGGRLRESLAVVGGVASILGHNYTCWLRFKGGKGIATSAGVLIGLVPWALLIILAVWLVVFALTRYVSLASVSAAVCLPLAVWLTRGSAVMIGISAFLGAMAVFKHRGNLQRLIAGTEHRFGSREATASKDPDP